ncbi:MAG: SUMF1/EgtB/PvdO family nonheme iron enzyme, partial [Gammaproteobacteria bacterium]|nr:SUMF1/EgtB/PvdO family nonheme iron enzyme [Gammaproteobacteria bacterium]
NELGDLWSSFSWRTSIPSTPAGATVYRRPFADAAAAWELLGTTPLYNIHVPVGPSLLRMELDGHPPLLRVIGGEINSSTEIPVWAEPFTAYGQITSGAFEFDAQDSAPDDMVRVPGQRLSIDGRAVDMPDFHISRFEVTNREFQAFVDAGGYSKPEFWKHEFLLDGAAVPFEEAQARFVDSTGRPGPATWEAGTYPDGEDDYPVAGVSWYEAAAFAEFSGKDLPTLHHWRRATAGALLPWTLPASNLDSDGPQAVGSGNGVDWTGAYDLAGNVREWCFNAVGDQHAILGAGWDDPAYAVLESVTDPATMPAFDRSATNGFRLAALSGERATLAALRRPVEPTPDPVIGDPVSDEVFAVLANNFRYDPVPLDPQVEETLEERHWTRLRVTVTTGYGNERLPLYLYLPKGDGQRFQGVVYWPTSGPLFQDSIDSERFALDFVVQNGRAVVFPVYDGTFDRRRSTFPGWGSVAGRDMVIAAMKDMRRAVDYLESRPDIDADALAYFGFSWGGRLGGIALAIEPRFRAGVLNQAGLQSLSNAETSVLNYLPRVKVPVLQFNGRYDTDFRFETMAKPYFELLGTDPEHKKHVVEPTGHFVSRPVVIGETLDWLDKYLGPVNR